jgi:hypothetical protein
VILLLKWDHAMIPGTRSALRKNVYDTGDDWQSAPYYHLVS